MRRIHIILFAILGTFFLFSCEQELTGPELSTNPEGPALQNPSGGTTYKLTEAMADDTLTTFEWNAADFGVSTATSYTLQMDTSSSFPNAVELGSTNSTSLGVLVSDLNSKLTSQLGVDDSTQTYDIHFRIRTVVNENVDTLYSEVLTLGITPYIVEINYPEIYVAGGYQGWNPAEAPALYSANFDDNYEGYVYMESATEFKFTKERNWAGGDWGAGESEGTISETGGNLSVSEGGYYKINVDVGDLTYSMLDTQWGVIGSATSGGWDSDQDMTYQPDQGVWTVTLDLTADEMKFRANDAWDLNYGDEGADGTLEAGAGNIPVEEAGTYLITLDLSSYPYTYSLEKQ